MSRPRVVPMGDVDAVLDPPKHPIMAMSPTAAWIKNKAKRAAEMLLKSPSQKHGDKYLQLEGEEGEPKLIKGSVRKKAEGFYKQEVVGVDRAVSPTFSGFVLDGDDIDELTLPNGGYSVTYSDSGAKTVIRSVDTTMAAARVEEEGKDVMTEMETLPLAQSTPNPGWLRRKKKFSFLKAQQREDRDTPPVVKEGNSITVDYSLPVVSEVAEEDLPRNKVFSLIRCNTKSLEGMDSPLEGGNVKMKKASPNLRAATLIKRKGYVYGKKAAKTPGREAAWDLARNKDFGFDIGEEEEDGDGVDTVAG
jgi:hypothetical protein